MDILAISAATDLALGAPRPDLLRLGFGLLFAGFASGAGLGLGFHRAGFLGGYGSLRRRLARLGRIAACALGGLTLVLALSPWPAPGTDWARFGVPAWAVGAVAMPLCCFLAAWRPGFRHLFPVPVLALLTGTLCALLGGTS